MPGLKIETAPATEPVTLQVMKSHLRVTINNDDALINTYMQAARIKVEGFLGRSLVNKVYKQSLDHFPHRHGHDRGDIRTIWGYEFGHRGFRHDHPLQIKLLRSPLVSVSKVEYLDLSGALQTMLPKVDRAWAPDTEFSLGDQILDANGNIQEITTAAGSDEDGSSESGGTLPTWATSVDVTTGPDGDLTWTCRGVAPVGDFLVDVDGEPPRLFPNVNLAQYRWPITQHVPNCVRITFVAGYGNDGTNVPAHFKTAIMIFTAGLYEFREPVSDLPLKELPSHLRDLLWEDRIKDFNPTEG